MNLQQLRYIQEIVSCNFTISDAAEALYTSQPNISKQIKQFEQEMGIEVFIRHGKRLAGLTEPGKQILKIAQRMLRDTENIRQVGQQFHAYDQGQLVIATTHTQARYALPSVIQKFTQRYPKIQLGLHQGSPTQIAEQLISGDADIGIATESLALYDDLITLPCYQWTHCVITPPNHPLQHQALTLKNLAHYPIITYDFAFSGRSKINQAFAAAGIQPNIALTAIDADVIKTYVELGMGVGIVAAMAYIPERDTNLLMLDAAHLFNPSTTRIALCKDSYLRGYTYDFIHLFAPQLAMDTIRQVMEQGKVI